MFSYPTSDKYSEALQHPQIAFSDPELRHGDVERNSFGLPIGLGGGFALTYRIVARGRKFAVRCFHKKTECLEERYQRISRVLSGLQNGPFVEFQFQPEGVLVEGKRYPIVKMRWVEGPLLGQYLKSIIGNRGRLEEFAKHVEKLANHLSDLGIAHGDIQNGNLIVANGGITLIDYDGMFVPGMRAGEGTERGHKDWQHPQRSHSDFGPSVDRFSFLMLRVSLAAVATKRDLFDKYNNEENLLFTEIDYKDPSGSRLFRELRSIQEISREVEVFQEVCASKPSQIPSLQEFEKHSARVTPISFPPSKSKQPAKPRAAYSAEIPVVPAKSYSVVKDHVGDRVELIGQIVEVYRGENRYGEYLFLNFGYHGTLYYVKAIIWSAGLREFKKPPTSAWVRKWVSITGLVNPPHPGPPSTTISITIQLPSQLHQISEEQAYYRLGVTLPAKSQDSNQQILDRILSGDSKLSPQQPSKNPSPAPTRNPSHTQPLEVCQLTGRTGLRSDFETCAVTGIRTFRKSLVQCEETKKWILQSERGKSDYSGKQVMRTLLLRSDKPPNRKGLKTEFGRCEISGKLLLLDELGRSSVSNKLVDRDLLRYSGCSGKPALAEEMVRCEETGIELLPSETARCAISGKIVDGRRLVKSEVSKALALPHLMQHCAVTQKRCLPTELATCEVTGKRVLPQELETCSVTGKRVIATRLVTCNKTGRQVLDTEIGQSAISGLIVWKKLLVPSERSPFRLGLEEELVICEETGRRLLLDEVARSAVSGRMVDRSLLQPCWQTGKLALPSELKQCTLTGEMVLPGELETCAITGLKGIRGNMLWCDPRHQYLLPPERLREELLAACARGAPYPDTYLGLCWANIPSNAFEEEALGRLSKSGLDEQALATLRARTHNPSMRCLLLRLQGRSWEAATEALLLLPTDAVEARRIIRGVASDLESGRNGTCRLPLEAARMRCQFLGDPWPQHYPLPELRSTGGHLATIMRSLIVDKLRGFLLTEHELQDRG